MKELEESKELEVLKGERLTRITALCSRSEHCASQIEEKLRQWGASEDEIESVIKRLEDEKYIDSNRFCYAFTNEKFRYNHWGRMKIGYALRQLRLPADDIAEALGGIDEEDYLQTLSDILRQKNRSLRDEDSYVRRGKLVRHAVSKGFETDLAFQMAEEICED